MQIRCSALPRIMACPASAQPPKIKIDGDSEPARMGTAVHEVLAQVVTEGLDAVPNLNHVEEKYGIADRDELRMLCWFGLTQWQRIRGEVRILAVEEAMESEEFSGVTITGTPDVVCAEGDTLVAIDWKSEWIERNHKHQLMGYLHMAAQCYPTYTNFKRITVWLRSSDIHTVPVSEKALDEWAAALVERVQHTDTYDPSPDACIFCPLAHECAARRVMIRASMDDMRALVDAGGEPPEQLAQVYPVKKMVGAILDQYDVMLKTVLADGPLPIGDGRGISLQYAPRDHLFLDRIAKPLMKAWSCKDMAELIELLGDDNIKVSKKTIEQVAGDAAFKNEKGKAKKEIVENLRHAGAIVVRTHQRLTIKKE